MKSLGVAILVGLGLLIAACSPPEAGESWPEGTWAYGRTGAVRPLLEDLGRLSGTPAAGFADAALEGLEGCRRFAWQLPGSSELSAATSIGDLECRDTAPDSVAAYLEATAAAWVLSGSIGEEGEDRWFVRGSSIATETGSQQLVLELPAGVGKGPHDLLLPSSGSSTTPLLAADSALIHLRMAMDRALDPSAWMPSGGPADQLFGLRGRLFSKAVLDGHWELVVLPPGEEGRLPLVLALGIRSRTAAETAVASLVGELSRIWGLVPRKIASGNPDDPSARGAEASCFDELRLLPGLEPCWRVTEGALIIAWNRLALEQASKVDVGVSASGEAPALLRVDFERFPAAERILEQRLRTESAVIGVDGAQSEARPIEPYPWRRWQVEGRRTGDDYRFEIVLEKALAVQEPVAQGSVVRESAEGRSAEDRESVPAE